MNLEEDENPFEDDNVDMMEDELPSELQNQMDIDQDSAL